MKMFRRLPMSPQSFTTTVKSSQVRIERKWIKSEPFVGEKSKTAFRETILKPAERTISDSEFSNKMMRARTMVMTTKTLVT
jgi:hypothetical protein